MKEDNDAKESELEHKRLTLQHTVLTSDHELLTNKFSDTIDNAPNSHEQYQRQIDDWHIRCSVKDAETKLLTRQVANLKAVILEQGLAMPPPEPVRTAAPDSAPAPAPAPSNPNGQEEFPAPGTGWQYTGADRAANRPN